jgi:general secretion pathway protein F
MQFAVRAYDPTLSAARSVVMEATSAAAALEQVRAQGLVALEVRSARRFALQFGQGRRARVRLFCIEVAALLRAGLSLPEALGSLAVRSSVSDAILHRQLHEHLTNGMRLSDALEQVSERFPPILVAAVRAGERTSKVADALEEFARFDEAVDTLRRRAINAAVYPAMVVGFGFLVALFLLGYVVPRFARIYETTAVTASAATRVLLMLGATIDQHRLAIGAGAVAIAVALLWVLSREDLRARALRWLTAFGLAAWIARRYQLARITQALSMLLRGGYPLPDALRLARALALRNDLAAGMDRVLVDVNEGRVVSHAWVAHGLGGEFDRRLLAAGERTGELGTVFDALSQAYTRDVETAMERASRFIEPALLMVVAVLIGCIVVLMYMPIFDLSGALR